MLLGAFRHLRQLQWIPQAVHENRKLADVSMIEVHKSSFFH